MSIDCGVADTALKAALGVSASTAGKEFAERAVKSIVKKADSVEQIFRDDFKIEGQEMTVLCPEGVQKFSIALTPKTSHLLPKSVKFSYGVPIRIEIRQVMGLLNLSDAVEITTNGFKVKLNKLTPGELYILDVEYHIDDHRFLDSLVDRTFPRDVPHTSDESIRQYEMSAQLKHLSVLKQKYYNVNLRDVDFTVDIAVHQDVKTTVPGIFRQQLETLVEFSKKKGRSEKFKLMMRSLQLQNQKYAGKELDILENLHELFTPMKFRRFVDVLKDFHYSDCMRGSDFYDTLPFPTWPKSMKIVSRTDLNLERPAADGVLAYKHADFVSEIEKVFNIDKNSKMKIKDSEKQK
jgi:hypothetical protein